MIRSALLALMLAFGLVGSMPADAVAQGIQSIRAPDIDTPDIDIDTPEVTLPRLPDTNGSLVFHGNYCGPGSRGAGRPPVDALDAACMHHDACTPPIGQGLPSCGCNARLRQEASLVARSRRTPDDLRITAQIVSEGAKVLACR